MKVLYINPNINHHKLPFYDALRNIYGQDNVIYATPLTHEENRPMQYKRLLSVNGETFTKR